jgi:Tfp pilus assembly protein PilN
MAAPGGSTNAELVRGGGLDVNLVPEEYQPEVTPKDKLIFGLSIGVALVLVAAIVVGLQLYSKRVEARVANVQAELDTITVSVSALESGTLGRAQVLQRLTGDVRRILDQHVYWDGFFQKLEAVTLPSVTYTNMSVDVSGTVTLSAVAKTYNDVGDQLLTMQQAKDFITDVTITSGTKSSAATPGAPGQSTTAEVVTFSISLRVVPTVFYQAAPSL